MSEIKVTQEQIDSIMSSSKIEDVKIGEKTTVVVCTTKSCFVIVESSSCVDPENYDHEIGKEICLDRIESKLWELEGYKLQCEKANVPASFKDRVLLEKKELDEKLDKLKSFLHSEKALSLNVEDQMLLSQQAVFMQSYTDVLRDRIKRF